MTLQSQIANQNPPLTLRAVTELKREELRTLTDTFFTRLSIPFYKQGLLKIKKNSRPHEEETRGYWIQIEGDLNALLCLHVNAEFQDTLEFVPEVLNVLAARWLGFLEGQDKELLSWMHSPRKIQSGLPKSTAESWTYQVFIDHTYLGQLTLKGGPGDNRTI